MANPIKGEVALSIGGVAYTLCLGINQIVELEAVTDTGIIEIAGWFNDRAKLRAGNMRAILWAALQKHHPEIDMIKAGDLMQTVGLMPVIEKLGQAIQAAFPEVKPENPRKRARAGTGKSS